MLLNVAGGAADDDAFGNEIAVIIRIEGSIDRYEEVRHDASATVDSTSQPFSAILQRIGEVNAVRVHQFSMVEAIQQVAMVLLQHIVAIARGFIRLLNATADRSIIACNGESYHRTIGQVNGALHQSLAEGAATHHHSTIPILDGTCHNFTGRSRIFIHQYHEAACAEVTIALCQKLPATFGASFGVDYQFALTQKLVGQIDGSIQVAASVPLQVQYQVFHTLGLQFSQGLGKLLARSGSKAIDAYVADARLNDIGGIEAVDRNLVALHGEQQRLLDTTPYDSEIHLRVLRPTQTAHNLVRAHLDARDSGVIDGCDAVACQDAHFLRRASADGLDDQQRVFYHLKLDADALEVALQRLVHGLDLFGVVVGGVGV